MEIDHLLSKKHTGMRVSASGILRRVSKPSHIRTGALQLLEHLREMASEYYSGNVKIVDEFLQLYCLDDKRPKVE